MNSLEQRVESLEKFVASLKSAVGGGGGSAEAKSFEIADARDLDGQYGNPAITKDPTEKYWTGPSYIGKFLSQTTPEYLLAFAKYKEACAFMSDKNAADPKGTTRDGQPLTDEDREKLKKRAHFDRKDASRARGWELRMRKSKSASPAVDENDDFPI